MSSESISRRAFLEASAVGAGVLLGAANIMAKEPTRAEELTQQKESLLAQLQRWCGEFPKRGEVNAQEVWRREFRTHTEVKVTYEGEPGERIPAYLLLPRKPIRTPAPAIFAAHQCGHRCDIGKEQVVGKCPDLADQAYGYELVKEGFVVLAPDANKVGERFDAKLRQPWQTVEDLGNQNSCCCSKGGGWGGIRWKRVYDVMRGIDYLQQRPEVDAQRIGMIGHSLGADTTIWSMPLEPRIRAAAISCGGIMAEGWQPYGISYLNCLRLIAPRPFFESTGMRDYGVNWCRKNSPASVDEGMAKKRRVHALAQEFYSSLGKKDQLGYLEHDCEHAFPEEGRRAAYAWLKKYLMHDGPEEAQRQGAAAAASQRH